MRILHDEQGLWNKENIVKAFVLGAIVSSCIIYMFLTEVIIVFFISLSVSGGSHRSLLIVVTVSITSS